MGAPSAHNAFLEITLELGLIGLASLILIVCQGLWRAIRCCALGLQPFGLFSLVFFVGAIMAGQTIETLGINQEIDWLVFNILSFLAGERAAVAPQFANREDEFKELRKKLQHRSFVSRRLAQPLSTLIVIPASLKD